MPAARNIDLSQVVRTVGGAKVREVYYAVTRNNQPAGIIGDMWRANAYRETRWYDDGTHAHHADWSLDLTQVKPTI